MSPPPAHEPFLRAICQAPDDDAPRLVFADYLDETGEPGRAAFIRRHIEFARRPDAEDLERWCHDRFRGQVSRWVTELPGPVSLWAEREMHLAYTQVANVVVDQNETWTERPPALKDWHRGFPATVYVQGSGDVFLAFADRIADFVPVHRLHLSNVDRPSDLIRALAGLPVLRQLRELMVSWLSLSDDAAVALAGSPFATGLRRLSLFADRMTDRAGRAFADSPYLRDIEVLHLLRTEFSESVRIRLRARFGFRVHC